MLLGAIVVGLCILASKYVDSDIVMFLSIFGIVLTVFIMVCMLVSPIGKSQKKSGVGEVVYSGYDTESNSEIIAVKVNRKYFKTSNSDIIEEYSYLIKGDEVWVKYDPGVWNEILAIDDVLDEK